MGVKTGSYVGAEVENDEGSYEWGEGMQMEI